MRRVLFAVLASFGLMASFMLSPAVAAPPAATFTASLTESPACTFTAVGSWKNAKVDTVYTIWSLDGVAFEDHLFTMEAPFTGPNAGTLKGRTATFKPGTLATTAEPHTIYMRIQFYGGGAHLGEILLNVSANCGRFV